METTDNCRMDIDQAETAEEDGNFKVLTEKDKKQWTRKYSKVYDKLRGYDVDEDSVLRAGKKMRVQVTGLNDILDEVGINEMITYDAKCISSASRMSYNLVKKFNTDCVFDKRHFAQQLRQRVLSNSRKSGLFQDTGPRRWIHFEHLFATGLAFTDIHHQVAAIPRSFISPVNPPDRPDNPGHPEIVVRPIVRQPQNRLGQNTSIVGSHSQATRLDSGLNLINEEDESEKRLRKIHGKYRKMQKKNNSTGTPLIQSAVNPNSFATTVENFFNISFLARQKMIKIDMPEDANDHEPIVKAFQDLNNKKDTITDDPKEIEADQKRKPIQSVLTFDYETYEALISNLEIVQAAFD